MQCLKNVAFGISKWRNTPHAETEHASLQNRKQKRGYFRALRVFIQMVGVWKILKKQMKAKRPSPPKQVSVLSERKTEAFLSEF